VGEIEVKIVEIAGKFEFEFEFGFDEHSIKSWYE
jgi:hypothetical protein